MAATDKIFADPRFDAGKNVGDAAPDCRIDDVLLVVTGP